MSFAVVASAAKSVMQQWYGASVFCNGALISCRTVIQRDSDEDSFPGAALVRIRFEMALQCPKYVLNGDPIIRQHFIIT